MWKKLTDDYVSTLNPYAKRKIRLQDGREQWVTWDKQEQCFFWQQGEAAVYMDDPHQRPTHVLVGVGRK